MQAAKEAINKITSNKGHRTDVDETIGPAVVKEQVKPHRHEEATQAVDREVHQDHYHTTVQPISHEEQLPEKHTHNLAPTEHREIHHEDPEHAKSQHAAHLAQFQPSTNVEQTTQSVGTAPAVTGEHVHHHVHETVVPVVHKSTIQPEVVHTTQPIHETHHAQSQHHGVSALPMKTLDEFKSAGGQLDGSRGASHEQYEGAPRQYNSKLETTMDKLGFSGDKEHHQQQQQQMDGGHVNPVGAGGGHVGGAGHGPGAGAVGAGAGAVGAGAGAGAVGGAAGDAALHKEHGHRTTDSGVGMGRNRTGSASSSDYEYAADGQKVKKSPLGGLRDKTAAQVS